MSGFISVSNLRKELSDREKDERFKSTVAINLFCIGNTLQSIIYKIMALEEKVTLLEYTVLRNFVIVGLSLILLRVREIDPIEALPRE